MPHNRILFSGLIPFTFNGTAVNDNRNVLSLGVLKGLNDLGEVVAINWADVAEPKRLTEHGG